MSSLSGWPLIPPSLLFTYHSAALAPYVFCGYPTAPVSSDWTPIVTGPPLSPPVLSAFDSGLLHAEASSSRAAAEAVAVSVSRFMQDSPSSSEAQHINLWLTSQSQSCSM